MQLSLFIHDVKRVLPDCARLSLFDKCRMCAELIMNADQCRSSKHKVVCMDVWFF